MVHNNKTPASVLTAPISVPKAVVSHTLVTRKETAGDGTERTVLTGQVDHVNHTVIGTVDSLTGVYTNPQRVERKARAALKRARRNKHRKGTKGTK